MFEDLRKVFFCREDLRDFWIDKNLIKFLDEKTTPNPESNFLIGETMNQYKFLPIRIPFYSSR